jgi:hypothetical protein
MHTNRTSLLIALVVIVLVSTLISACNPFEAIRVTVNAATDTLSWDDSPVTPRSVANSPRLKTCSMHDIVRLQMEAEAWGPDYTMGEFLSMYQPFYACIQ